MSSRSELLLDQVECLVAGDPVGPVVQVAAMRPALEKQSKLLSAFVRGGDYALTIMPVMPLEEDRPEAAKSIVVAGWTRARSCHRHDRARVTPIRVPCR